MDEPESGTGYTEASAEMGLPIQGYLMRDGKRDSAWLAMAEEEEGEQMGKGRGTRREAFD